MNEHKNILENPWPAASIVGVVAFIGFFAYIVLALKPGFPLYATIIILGIILAPSSLFLELTGAREKLWNIWKSWPIWLHKAIFGICLCWTGYFIIKVFIPLLKKNYEEN